MITLPKALTATKYPGYFWDTASHKLYSIKVGGELRELKLVRPNAFNNMFEPAYRVSVGGKQKYLSLSYLESLPLEDGEIPIAGAEFERVYDPRLFGVGAQIFNIDSAYRTQMTTEVDYGSGPRLPINRRHLEKFLRFPTSVAGTYNTGDIDPSRLFFASDHHFGHNNIIKYAGRPFASVEEMNEEMVRRHNEVVGEDDFCVFGGDIGFAPASKTNQWLDRMNGKKIFVLGNHDFEKDGRVKRYSVDCEQLWWRVPGIQEEFTMVFTHYPLDGLPDWMINLHGHIHEKQTDNPQHINLCVEMIDYTPMSLEQVLRIARMRYIEMQG